MPASPGTAGLYTGSGNHRTHSCLQTRAQIWTSCQWPPSFRSPWRHRSAAAAGPSLYGCKHGWTEWGETFSKNNTKLLLSGFESITFVLVCWEFWCFTHSDWWYLVDRKPTSSHVCSLEKPCVEMRVRLLNFRWGLWRNTERSTHWGQCLDVLRWTISAFTTWRGSVGEDTKLGVEQLWNVHSDDVSATGRCENVKNHPLGQSDHHLPDIKSS